MTDNWCDKVLMAIPSVNGGQLLARMLPTLRFKRSNVIILDQGSTDETVKICWEAGVELIQLGQPHTYTQACNIGAKIAGERGSKYLCVSNNDIVFTTDVLAELFAEMERDPRLGIVAPSQVIVDERIGTSVLSSRVYWDLARVDFLHDTRLIESATARLESDFCELTCALVRMSSIDEIGFLDDDYGFYHEDADFGFRLRKAGYSCAYIPRSQIKHFSGSTFNREAATRKRDYIAKNKVRFVEQHLGYGMSHQIEESNPAAGSAVLSTNIHPYLRRYGLLAEKSDELVVSDPGAESSGYLYTSFEARNIPARWIKYKATYRAIFTTSEYMRCAFRDLGVTNCYHIPLGVETDIFHPWGTTRRIYDSKTYLAFVDGWQEKLFRKTLESWRQFVASGKNARLILFGRGVGGRLGRSPDMSCRSAVFEIEHYDAERIASYEVLLPLVGGELAQFYRSIDFTILSAEGEEKTRALLESVACGVPCIFANYGAPAEYEFHGALTLGSRQPLLDSGLVPEAADVAADWKATVDQLVARLEESYNLDQPGYDALANRGIYMIRNQATLRHSTMALYRTLARLQLRDPVQILQKLVRSDCPATPPTALSDEGTGNSGRHFGSVIARRIDTVGRLTSQFGCTWAQRGLVDASRGTLSELGYFMKHRLRKAARFSSKEVRLAPMQNSALLIGYIDAQLGLGQSVRGLALAMERSGVQFSIYPFGIGVEGRRSAPYMPDRYDKETRHAVNIIEVATDELPTVFRHISEGHFSMSYNILRTYWELSRAPDVWRSHLQSIDEIWAPTVFVAESFRRIFDRPIIVVPPCVDILLPELDGRQHFGLRDEKFYFLFSFDYFSFPGRKNPLAVVRAFCEAFPKSSPSVGLIIKSSGLAGHFPDIKEQLRSASRNDERIEIINETMTRAEMLALIGATDCYVSLHRSEGFGLGMAEAMALGKPVIGTGYSGSVDFLTEETGYTVPFVLKNVRPGDYVHPEDQVWAYPHEAACSAAMVRVVNDHKERTVRALAGKAFVKERYGVPNVANIVKQRLNEIFGRSSDRLERMRRMMPNRS